MIIWDDRESSCSWLELLLGAVVIDSSTTSCSLLPACSLIGSTIVRSSRSARKLARFGVLAAALANLVGLEGPKQRGPPS